MTGLEDQCSRTPEASLYVLGELQGRHLDSFARHLGRCDECSEEVELLRQAADAVPLLASRQGPLADEEPQFEQRPPRLAVAASAGRAATSASRAQAAPSASRTPAQVLAARPVLRPIEGGAAGARAGLGGGRRLTKNPIPKPAMIGLLALAILAIATVALSSQAANVHYYRIQAGWSRGGAALQIQGNKLQLLVEGMPKPAKGGGYEVWVVDRQDKQLTATGVWLHLNSLGQARVTVPGDYHDWLAVAVYTEPLTGRDTTNSGAAVVGDLRSVS
jgi:hypothetical protein